MGSYEHSIEVDELFISLLISVMLVDKPKEESICESMIFY